MGHRHQDHEHDHEHVHGHDEGPHFGGPPFGGGPWAGRGRGRGRFAAAERGGWGGGRRMRRGDIRRAILHALREAPAHGYEVMRRLEEMSGGLWRPSPGSVYPHLQMLEDEGMVRSTEVDGTRTYELTDTGRTEAEADPRSPWESGAESEDGIRNLKHSMGQLLVAAKQISGVAEQAQVERAIEVLRKARQELYKILAED